LSGEFIHHSLSFRRVQFHFVFTDFAPLLASRPFSTVQFVGISAFHTQIADPLIGGTYMTVSSRSLSVSFSLALSLFPFMLLTHRLSHPCSFVAPQHSFQPGRNLAETSRSSGFVRPSSTPRSSFCFATLTLSSFSFPLLLVHIYNRSRLPLQINLSDQAGYLGRGRGEG